MYDPEMRKDCPMRGSPGNCYPVGGFCTDAVSDEICEALHNAYDHGFCNALKKQEVVKDLNVPGKWHNVKAELPDTDDHVLCCTKTKAGLKNVVIGYYMDGTWRCGMNSNVTHWMPLPKPPEEEQDG